MQRDWMDATHERHAYRCLPLSIANACGWEILNPVAFSAIWDGGDRREAIHIDVEGDTHSAITHFGAGVLTFHVTGLFETPPGVMIWVGGSPNRFKDAIQPMTGLVETAWSPYSFTMNWKFTKAGQRIRFEKDEPFCFIMPIDPGLAEACEPEFRSLDDNQDLAANYHEWRLSRSSFNTELKQPGSDAATKKWQKTYHMGVRPDGTKPEAGHRTKIKLRKFDDKTK